MECVEVRAFSDLKKLFDERGLAQPVKMDINGETTARGLAEKLDIPRDKIEIIFVNGKAQSMDCPVKAGDRVAFVPPGTPGPYRVLLGFMQKKENTENQ